MVEKRAETKVGTIAVTLLGSMARRGARSLRCHWNLVARTAGKDDERKEEVVGNRGERRKERRDVKSEDESCVAETGKFAKRAAGAVVEKEQ